MIHTIIISMIVIFFGYIAYEIINTDYDKLNKESYKEKW